MNMDTSKAGQPSGSILKKQKIDYPPLRMGVDVSETLKEFYLAEASDTPEDIICKKITVSNTCRNSPQVRKCREEKILMANWILDCQAQLRSSDESEPLGSASAHMMTAIENTQPDGQTGTALKTQAESSSLRRTVSSTGKRVIFSDVEQMKAFKRQQKCGAKTSKY